MLTRVTAFLAVLLALVGYAASPAPTSAQPNTVVACCDGDPAGPP